MDAGRRQILALALAIIGVLGTIIICALPAWKVFINVSKSHNEPEGTWCGLWKLCVVWNSGKMDCHEYGSSTIPIPEGMNTARVIIIMAIIIGVFGILLAMAGNKRTNVILDDGQKRKVGFASGVVFIIAGFLVLIPVCWIANIIIRESYNFRSQPDSTKLGASPYIGWFTTGFLFLAGGLLLYPQK